MIVSDMVNSNQKIEIAFHLNTKDATPLQTWPEVEPDDWGGLGPQTPGDIVFKFGHKTETMKNVYVAYFLENLLDGVVACLENGTAHVTADDGDTGLFLETVVSTLTVTFHTGVLMRAQAKVPLPRFGTHVLEVVREFCRQLIAVNPRLRNETVTSKLLAEADTLERLLVRT